MGQYLIDNNVISKFFSNAYHKTASIFIAGIIDEIPNISVITQIEALSWVNPDKAKETIVHEFIRDTRIISLSPDIVDQCISIRRSRSIKTPDAIIAATAIVYDLTLVTSDADFLKIPGLKIVNPADMQQ